MLGGALAGLLVGLTGTGGGALVTPMLILVFGLKAPTAISSDLLAALVMRPFGAAVHLKRKTVNLRLVGWLMLGSIPAALLGSYLLGILATSASAKSDVELAIGAALLAGAMATMARSWLDRRRTDARPTRVQELNLRPLGSCAIGAVGGMAVGMTSVGSGSLIIVLLLFLYPSIGTGELVGTDLTQAVPLSAAAGLGAVVFGHVDLSVTEALIVGGVPGVMLGSAFSSRAPERYIRPLITVAILAAGLDYLGLNSTVLALSLPVVLLVVLTTRVANSRGLRLAIPRRGPAPTTRR